MYLLYINQANNKNITVLPVIRSDYIICIICVILFDVMQKLILDSESFAMHTEGLECVWVHVATLSLALSAISVVQLGSKGCWFPRNKTWHKEEGWVSTKHTLGISSWLKKKTNPKTLKISILIRKFTLPCLHLQVCMKTGCITF